MWPLASGLSARPVEGADWVGSSGTTECHFTLVGCVGPELLERLGKTLGALDMMIGAHALSLGAVLVTNDQSFRSVPDLELEDWTQNSSGSWGGG